MAQRKGFIVNGDVEVNGELWRVYGNGFDWKTYISGQVWLQKVGDAAYFRGDVNLLTFDTSNSVHVEASGVYNKKAANLILDLTNNLDTVKFTLKQAGQPEIAMLEAQAIVQSDDDPSENKEYVTIFAPTN